METGNGVRQGCPISSILFNTVFSDLESEMRKVQETGIIIGKTKIWTVNYADDVLIMADNEIGMKEDIRWFAKYIKSKGLELNTSKTKILLCRKGGGRKRKNPIFKWGNEKIEIVKRFNYLGYILKKNNNDDDHIKYLAGKANAVLGKIWGIEERLFNEQ